MTAVLMVGALVAGAVLVWPGQAHGAAGRVLTSGPLPVPGPERRARPARDGRARRRREQNAATVLRLLEAMTSAITAGVPPAQAIAVALEATTVRDADLRARLAELVERARDGEELGTRWSALAAGHGLGGLEQVGRAWMLSERLGTPLGDALLSATGGLRARIDHERRVRVLIAGPRATMQLLTLLPVAGAGLAPLVGVSPAQVYSGPVLLLACLPGVVLLLVGRLVVSRMVARATRERSLT